MDTILGIFSVCLALGAVVGFIAGLLGIGGGLIVVPALLYILPNIGIPEGQLTHVAIATSLAAIILTSLSSAKSHHKRGNVPWHLFKSTLPGLICGALVSGFIAELIPSESLQRVFAVFVILMAIQMSFPIKIKSQPDANKLPAAPVLFGVSGVFAIISALMGIGGGTLFVPFLSRCGLQMRQAVGFSSANSFIIALWGSIGYIIAGWNAPDMPEGTFGYIYLPAFVGIVLTSMLTAPIGVKAASVWSTPVLKKIFAALLVVVGLKLLLL